ncbi:tRNA (adenosine(37)-N6)-threonylcarbamoyltransferase complex ATPase subunit type 1 TsaE [Nocardiopsis sp. NPDC006832]|uniref:tRNA (adenosine(37)-N6)-threonylcarbamoyltransferase complex ATPase subunit type 1 TsaE n=1 Tax=Nocardiopsis sp. NPDC006832 TaxID=3157188 RepID=UPI0033D51F4A
MITIHNLNEMDKFAQILVKHLSAKDLILLNGDLGAGKTTLTQFIGKALGVKRTINSPTFNIIKSYTGSSIRLHHMDCYRLEGEEDDLRPVPSRVSPKYFVFICNFTLKYFKKIRPFRII